jgi:pilus assembly protein CpaC
MTRKNVSLKELWQWMLLSVILLFVALPAQAVVFDPVFKRPVKDLQVPINQSRILLFDENIGNISVGNPEVADVIVLESRKIYVVGKSLGSTNVVVWGKGKETDQHYTTFKVEITYDLDGLKQTLHKLMPNEKPQIHSTEGAIILSGEVSSSVKMDAIMELATQFVTNTKKFSLVHKKSGGQKGEETPPEIVNLMQEGGPHQVMLKFKVAEVSKSVFKQLGINLASYRYGSPWVVGAVNGGASFPNAQTISGEEIPIFPNDVPWTAGSPGVIGPNIDQFEPTLPAISGAGLFGSYLKGDTYLQMIIDASKNDGLAKILAEPTLTTLSGEPASFLSGGEFPIPVWNGDKGISVTFKEFGIAVKVLPIVLDSDRINLNLNVSVSELMDSGGIASAVPTSSVSFNIPSLSTRSASSTVELMDGQTIGIAGLISDKMREAVNKFPGLGDIPVLGALFRSQQYIQDKSELVMFVTAHMAKPIDPNKIRLPTDAFVDPGTASFFLLGRMQGSKSHIKKRPVLAAQAGSSKKAVEEPRQDSDNEATEKKSEPVQQPNRFDGPTFGHDL